MDCDMSIEQNSFKRTLQSFLNSVNNATADNIMSARVDRDRSIFNGYFERFNNFIPLEIPRSPDKFSDITYNITINVALSGDTLIPKEIGRDDIRTIYLLFNNDSTDPPKLLFRIFDDINIIFLDSLPIITMSYEQYGRIVRETSRVTWSDCFNILNTQDGSIPLIKGQSLQWIVHRNYVHSIRFDNSGIKFQIKWWAKEFKLYTFIFRFNL